MGLAHKILTISCCIFYFSVVEKVPVSEILVQNFGALYLYVTWVHISSCFILDFEPVYFKKLGSENQVEFILRIGKVVFKYANFAMFIILSSLWPLFAWLNWSWT